MHNLALALHQKGLQISGSDDELYEPSKSRLEKSGIIKKTGWNPDQITTKLNAVIVGMHAKKDNVELLKAKELNIPIYSFPEYIHKHSIDKQRIVITGSHGKTTITSMILHVLKKLNKKFDYAVGAYIDGFERMVQLSDAPIIIIEGDEYLSSPLDLRPKFLNYDHHIVVVNGIAWDHMNVFPTFESYTNQFQLLLEKSPKSGSIIYYEKDEEVRKIASKEREDVKLFPYEAHETKYIKNECYLINKKTKTKVNFFGEHNMINLSAAKQVCLKIGVSEEDFYDTISSFKGASKRLEVLAENNSQGTVVYKDFAHAPSKLKASCKAMKERFPKRKLIACMELHTFSSLSKDFLPQYKNSFNDAEIAIVFINPKTLANKNIKAFSENEIRGYFNNQKITLIESSNTLQDFLLSQEWSQTNLLLMSSGNFDNLELEKISNKIVNI